MIDISIFESGSGGEMRLLKNDLEKTDSFFNMIYLAMFGGNVEASTKGNEIPTEQRKDWWGNSLLFENEPTLQFNSDTERLLTNTPINSEARGLIENTVKSDLKFLKDFAEVSVSVSLVSADRILIQIFLKQLDNLQEKEYQFIWDASKSELIESLII